MSNYQMSDKGSNLPPEEVRGAEGYEWKYWR